MPHAKESSEFYPWPEIFKHHIIYVTQPLELANLEDAYVILFFMSETKVNGNLRHVNNLPATWYKVSCFGTVQSHVKLKVLSH